MSVDRLTDGYQPDFDIDQQVGRQGELWVTNIIRALLEGRSEVKTEEAALRYGNLYVEFQCLRRGRWRWSGIATTKAEVWVSIPIPDGMAIVISTERLRSIVKPKWLRGDIKECVRGSHPTRGVTVPIRDLFDLVRKVS